MKLHLAELFHIQALLEQQIAERGAAEAALSRSEKQLRYLSAELLRGHEQEKRRLAYELHEELGQSLAAFKILLKLITRSVPPDDADVQQECRDGVKQIDEMIEKIRRLSRALSPAILEDLGLSAALRRLVVTSARESSIECSVEIPEIDGHLARKNQILLYRILQEALSNIEAHSEATRQSVVIDERNGSLSVVIDDNGKGFDPALMTDQQDTRRGIGLAVMKERARMLGGSFHLWSERGKGTRITLRIPKASGNSESSS
jgi:signal transduction histidine kinase